MQAVLVGNLEPVELELAVAAVLLRSHDRNAPHDAPAGLVAVEHERGESLARVVGGLRDQDEVLRDAGAGDEPLAPVHDPAGRPARRGRLHHRRIGAAARRGSVMTNARAHAAVDDRLRASASSAPVATLLSTVMLPSSGAAQLKHDRPEDRVVHLLVARRDADDRQPEPPRSRGICGAHRPAAFASARTRCEEVERDVLVLVEGGAIGSSGRMRSRTKRARRARAALRHRAGQREVHGSEPSQGVAAVDRDGRAGHVAPGVGGEEQQRAVEVVGLAEAPLRHALAQRLARGRAEEVAVELGLDVARARSR